MANRKGQRKYRCDDCGATRMLHWVELNRASRPRCMACGSQRLEPYSEQAIKDRDIGDLNVRQFEYGRGDVIGANSMKRKPPLKKPEGDK